MAEPMDDLRLFIMNCLPQGAARYEGGGGAEPMWPCRGREPQSSQLEETQAFWLLLRRKDLTRTVKASGSANIKTTVAPVAL